MKMYLLTLTSLFSIASFAGPQLDLLTNASILGINVHSIGQTLTQLINAEISGSNKYSCRTNTQGFGPYKGEGSNLVEASDAALKKCGIFCDKDQSVVCSDSKGQIVNMGTASAEKHPVLAAAVVVPAPTVQIQSASCSKELENLGKWKDYAETLKERNTLLMQRLVAYEGNNQAEQMAHACKYTLGETSNYLHACYATKASIDQIIACKKVGQEFFKFQCIESKASIEKIASCAASRVFSEDIYNCLQE